MRRDHRPYFIKRSYIRFQHLYTRYFIKPQLDSLGRGFMFIRPWYIKIFGKRITIGDYANILAESDNKVRLTVWPEKKDMGRISIGDYCLICPGVRISSAAEIAIKDSCMIASNAFITDTDWHGTYDRIKSLGNPEPVYLLENAWIGDGATVCKGVTIGENSIIGAGSVVVKDVPANVIAAGNPARVMRELDTGEPMIKRSSWFAEPDRLDRELQNADRQILSGNTVMHWLKTLVVPGKSD
ncbi:MAG: acyltransferase [Desulfobacterales bacterium]|nr:acyltransferase [Desulfobacterales bacterium]